MSFFVKGYWIFALAFIGVLCVLIWSYQSIPVYRAGEVTQGRIKDTWIASDSRYIEYIYIIDNKEYRNEISTWMDGLNQKDQHFYVLYLTGKPEDHIILYGKDLIHDKALGEIHRIYVSDREIFRGLTGF